MKASVSLLTGAFLLSIISPAFAAAVPQETGSISVAMSYAEEQNLLEPMSDGLMHEEMPIARKDIVTSVVRSIYKDDIRKDCFDRISPDLPAKFTRLFRDITVQDANAMEICVGMFVGLVEGESDGSFGPLEGANLVEVAKVITKAYGIAPLPSLRVQSRVPWHEPFWFALAKRNAIPETVASRDSVLTRGEFAEILYRLRNEKPTHGFSYKKTMISPYAQTEPSPATEAVTPSLPDQPEQALQSAFVPLKEEASLHAGLALQMHTEERRLARLEKQEALSASSSALQVANIGHTGEATAK